MLLFLLACEPSHSPEWVAQQACAVVPGLQLESAAQAMGAEALHPDELQVWHDDGEYGVASYGAQPYGQVIEAIGLEGMGVIRANSLCELQGIEWDDVGGGTGIATLTRSEPLPLSIESWDNELVVEQPRVDRVVKLDLVHTEDGWRAITGLVPAREQAAAAEELAAAGDHAAAIAAYEQLHQRFPDPRIPLRVQQLQLQRRVVQVRAEAYLQVEDDSLYLVNPSGYELPRGRLTMRCGEAGVAQDHPRIAAGQRWWLGIPAEVDVATCEKVD